MREVYPVPFHALRITRYVSESVEDSDEPVIDVNLVPLSEQRPAFSLDADFRFFLVADGEVVHFTLGLIEEADGFLYGLLVDGDQQTPEELVGAVFQLVLLDLSDFNDKLQGYLSNCIE